MSYTKRQSTHILVSSVGYKGYLIVAGGRERIPEDCSLISHQIEVPSLSTVEILDLATSTARSLTI
jgi:hypothetical protein